MRGVQAAALEAQGKLAEAKASLEGTLKASPETLGLRERLAQVFLKMGKKDEAKAELDKAAQAVLEDASANIAMKKVTALPPLDDAEKAGYGLEGVAVVVSVTGAVRLLAVSPFTNPL